MWAGGRGHVNETQAVETHPRQRRWLLMSGWVPDAGFKRSGSALVGESTPMSACVLLRNPKYPQGEWLRRKGARAGKAALFNRPKGLK